MGGMNIYNECEMSCVAPKLTQRAGFTEVETTVAGVAEHVSIKCGVFIRYLF